MRIGPFATAAASIRRIFLSGAVGCWLLAVVIAAAQTPTPIPEAAKPSPGAARIPSPAGLESGIKIEGEKGFFTENDTAHGVGRTTVTYGDMKISADHLAIDMITQQVDAEGNVLFTTDRDQVRASAGHYDFRRSEGVAYDVEGVSGPIHFRTEWDEQANGASFRRISEDEAVFRGASYTTSGFPVPTWRIEAKEIILIPGERIFMRGATLYVRETPVFYWPVYTRSLQGTSPWSFEVGVMHEYGVYASVRYRLIHESRVPSIENPNRFVTRDNGRVDLRTDFFSAGALGVGLDYKYTLDYGRHMGELELYGIRDNVRDIDEASGDHNRYLYRHRHNTMWGKTITQLSAEWMSDPEVEYDFMDPFKEEERGRRPERRGRAAFTYLEQDYIARLSGEIKDRVTLPRYGDYTEPQDDDLNYDTDPNLAETGNRSDGISNDRYGRVTERYQGRVASRLLPLFGSPISWDGEINAFDALDAGFNELSEQDDERIGGGDFYGALSHRVKLDPQGRFTWLNSVGIGAGFYKRTSDDLVNSGRTFPAGGGTLRLDGQRYLDRETISLGEGSRDVSYRDVDPTFLWADYTSRLNARLSENLAGYLKYTLRKGTSHGVGDFYEKVGRTEAFEDVYNFPVEKQWLEAYMNYSPLFPKIETYAMAGYNLQSREQIFANERLYYVGGGATYESDSGEWKFGSEALLDARQARDRHDPGEYEFREIAGSISADYVPLHGRYWGGLSIDGSYPLSDDPVAEANRKEARFTEDRQDIDIRPRIGRQFGPKYQVELIADYNTRIENFKEAGVQITRDLYDADLTLFTGVRSRTADSRDDDDDTNSDSADTDRELAFRAGLRFKVPEESSGLSSVSMRTMRDRRREASFVE